MKSKLIFLPMVLFLVLCVASCGSDKVSSITADAPKEAASKITVQSVLTNMEKGKYTRGEVLVKFKSGVMTTQSLRTHQALGASVVKRFSSVPNLERIKLPAGLSVKDALVRYMSDPNVEYAEPNYIRRISVVPNDAFFGQQWALRNTGLFAGGTAGADIKAPEAWDIWNENDGIVIAVLDTGIDLNHPDLVGNIWTNPGEIPTNGIDDDANGKVDDWRGWDFTTCAKFDLSNLTITTSLSGAQEVPPVATSATGSSVLTVNLDTLTIGGSVTFSGLSSNATTAHIYQGAALTNGSIIVDLTGGAGGTSGTWTIPATVLTSGQLSALMANGLYINIRSASHTSGEIRGQIIFPGDLNCLTTKPESNNPSDDNGHGTHVSGIIGAKGNNVVGTSGVMWKVKIMPLKFLNADGFGSVGDELHAIDYAVKMKTRASNSANIKAINASFGSSEFSLSERDMIASAGAAGIVFVAAAGNEQNNNDVFPEFPASYSAPSFGGLTNIISVAATDQNDTRASFSGYGLHSVQVAAPGVYILSTVPLSGVAGSFSSLCTGSFAVGYDFCPGTSMAAPHVAGLVGLVSSYYTNFNHLQVLWTVLRYTDLLPSLNGWIQTGGRINAYRALSSLLTPTGLGATADSSSQITLAWTGNATGEDGYKIERKTGSGSFAQITTIARISRPDAIPMPPVTYTFVNTGLVDGTSYSYQVRAFNTIPADSFYSNVSSAVTPLNAPTALTATGISTTQITLSWTDNSQTEDGYAIERLQAGGFVQIATVGPNITTFTQSGLSSSTSYTYRVRAFNAAAGTSLYSNEATGTTLAAPGDVPVDSGGGGCSIGARKNTPTAVADLGVLLMPLALMVLLRRRR
jgi:subtilisin family serine protease